MSEATTKVNLIGDGGLGPMNGMSRSDTTVLAAAFPAGTPEFESEGLIDDGVGSLLAYWSSLTNGIINSPDFGDVSMNFAGAPVMGEVAHGEEGKPGNPYTPNVNVEGEAPAKQVAMEGVFAPKTGYGVGVGSQLSPDDSSATQASGREELQLGRSPYNGKGAYRPE